MPGETKTAPHCSALLSTAQHCSALLRTAPARNCSTALLSTAWHAQHCLALLGGRLSGDLGRQGEAGECRERPRLLRTAQHCLVLLLQGTARRHCSALLGMLNTARHCSALISTAWHCSALLSTV